MKQSRNLEVLEQFENLHSWEDRYGKIISMGRELPSFPEQDKEDKWLVKGCQSRLWLKPEFKNGKIIFSGDSDALISKGILALMIFFYSNRAPSDILEDKASFLTKLDLNQNLSSHRAQSAASLNKQILQYAQVFILVKKA